MNLPNKHDLIEMIAQEACFRYLNHFTRYKTEAFTPSEWVQRNYQDFGDFDCFHRRFNLLEDMMFEKWDDYDERFEALVLWFINRYLTEIDNRIGELL